MDCSALDLLGALTGPQTLRRKLCLHFILYLHVATPLILAVCIQRKCKVYSINATFVTSYNTTKVRSLDVIVPRPSTNINAKRISITGIYFAFFFWEGGIEMTDWMNLLCWYIFIINAMQSCSERTTLHCVESYSYYIILVNKKIFSEEWNEGEKKIDNTLSKIYHLYISVLTSFSYLFRSEWKWIIYFPTMYLYCIYRLKETVKLSKKSRNKRCSYHFWLCPLWSPRL